jgi:hypothetical protein
MIDGSAQGYREAALDAREQAQLAGCFNDAVAWQRIAAAYDSLAERLSAAPGPPRAGTNPQ